MVFESLEDFETARMPRITRTNPAMVNERSLKMVVSLMLNVPAINVFNWGTMVDASRISPSAAIM